MGKYLKNFNTTEEYEAFREGDQYLVPNVSFIENTASVINDSWYVPQSGGSGGEGGGSAMIYVDTTKLPQDGPYAMVLSMIHVIAKVDNEGEKMIVPPVLGQSAPDITFLAIGYIPTMRIFFNGQFSTAQEFLTSNNMGEVITQAEITEEEFYTI